MKQTVETFREIVLREKRQQGLTWETMAERADVSVQHLRGVAHQHINPLLDYAARVLEALGVGMWIGASRGEGEAIGPARALTYEELCLLEGEPVWTELANGKWVCQLIYQQRGEPVTLGLAVFTTGHMEPVKRLLTEGFSFRLRVPKGGM